MFRLAEGHSRAIDRVESIINVDRKVATYKLALIRALCNIATTSWASGVPQAARPFWPCTSLVAQHGHREEMA